MNLNEEIKKISDELGGKTTEKNEVISVEATIAERKAFLSKKKLTYIFKVRVDESAKKIKFTEMLKEAGSGLSSGMSFGDDMSPGFGFKKEVYNTTSGTRQGSIKEDSKLFGKDYKYNFDYAKIREKVEKLAKDAGYTFEYQILPIGF
jgi:hypothetical protein